MQDNTRTGRKPCFLFACRALSLYSAKLRIVAHKIVIFQNCIFLFSPPRSFFNIPFFCSCRFITPQKIVIFKNYHFSRRASQLFAIFKNYHPRSCRFPKRAFSAISATSIIVFQYFTFLPVRRDLFCFPKRAFIAPVLPSLHSFQIP